MWSGMVAALGLLLAAELGAQQPPSFRSGVALVTVSVSLSSDRGPVAIPVPGPSDFRVLENGVEQSLSFVEPDTRPHSIAILVDVSGSMAGRPREWAAEAIRAIVSRLGPDDEVSLVAFGGWSIVPIAWTRVSQLDGVDWAQWVVTPETALLDAVQNSFPLMDDAPNPRGAMVILSDGLEETSTTTLATVVKTRRQSETEVYAFEFDAPFDSEGRPRLPRFVRRLQGTALEPDYMGRIVGDSGGVVYLVREQRAVIANAKAFIANLKSQYLLGYDSNRPMDGKYHRIKVEARNEGLRVRHRGGLLAMPAGR